MTDRLSKIYNVLPKCKVFADIGCDHGYIAYEMLKNGKSEEVIISDISAKSLSKAQKLLSVFGKKVQSVVSDGFDNVGFCDLALISGMGGKEIISILKRRENLPEKLVLQPMKNCDRVREVVVNLGYKFVLDKIFFAEGKFYDILSLERGEDILTEEEKKFGRTNIEKRHKDFVDFVKCEMHKIEVRMQSENMKEETKNEMVLKFKELQKYV